jgi:AraC family transcriptional regulator
VCAIEVTDFPADLLDFTRLRIPPHTYAVFEHREHISSIVATIKAIWERGLAEAGCEPADGVAFERYDHRFDPKTGLGGLEIWVPITT